MSNTNTAANQDVLDAIAALKSITIYTLANMADVHTPDSEESPGGNFLDTVRVLTVDALEYLAVGNGLYSDLTDVAEFATEVNSMSGVDASEIADSSVPIYNYGLMLALVDLCAWDEDVRELSADSADILELSGIALYMVAERLAVALIESLEG